jgi:hypothetical protein
MQRMYDSERDDRIERDISLFLSRMSHSEYRGMQASVLEAALMAMCFLYPNQLRTTTIYKNGKFRRKRSRALDFTPFELIRIANELGWFRPKVITWGKRTTLAGFAKEIRTQIE